MAVSKSSIIDPPKWLLLWFSISSLIVIWDTGYILARPHSFDGGKLHFLWKPYKLYGDIDLIYSKRFYELHNGFTLAQGLMNIVETSLNFLYIYLAFFQQKAKLRAVAPVIGFAVAIMTSWKTILYWLQDYLSGPKGWGYTGHSNAFNFWIIFVLPNIQWIIIPTIISFYLGNQLFNSLIQAAGLAGPAGGTRSKTSRSSSSNSIRSRKSSATLNASNIASSAANVITDAVDSATKSANSTVTKATTRSRKSTRSGK